MTERTLGMLFLELNRNVWAESCLHLEILPASQFRATPARIRGPRLDRHDWFSYFIFSCPLNDLSSDKVDENIKKMWVEEI